MTKLDMRRRRSSGEVAPGGGGPPSTTTRQRRLHRQGMVFIAPAAIVLLTVSIVPVAYLLYVSMLDLRLGMSWDARQFVGLDNYLRMLSGRDQAFWPSVRISLILVTTTTVASMLLGGAIALMLNRPIRFKPVILTALLVPMVLTPAAAGLIWRLMYSAQFGIINVLLEPFGVQPVWLGSGLALTSVGIIEVWQWTPFVALILYAGLQSLPLDPIEAAQVDGASPWQVLRHITLPLLQPIIGLVLVLRVIDSLKIFDTVFALTRGGPGGATRTLGLHVYRQGLIDSGQLGRASAAGVMLLVLVAISVRPMIATLRKAEERLS